MPNSLHILNLLNKRVLYEHEQTTTKRNKDTDE